MAYQTHRTYYISEIILASDNNYHTAHFSSVQLSVIDSLLIIIFNCKVL